MSNIGDIPIGDLPIAAMEIYRNGHSHRVIGLTKREYFAGLAMQGILASDIKKEMSLSVVYEWAVKNADALLQELDK